MIAIGVDGGGSKTDVALFRDDGHALALARGAASHAHHHGVTGALDVIEAALAEALAVAGLTRDGGPIAEVATLTLAGADFDDEVHTLTAAVNERGWSRRTVVLNDTFAAVLPLASLLTLLASARVVQEVISREGETSSSPQ